MAENWKRKRISELCVRITSGGTPSRSNAAFYDNGTVPWVKTKELNDSWILRTEENITEEAVAASSAKILPENTVLLAMYGATVGKLGILSREMACNQACCAMIADPSILNYRYLFYSLLFSREKIRGLANGAAQQNISGNIVKQIIIPVPTLREQEAIVELLGVLDDKIAVNERIGVTADSLAMTLYKQERQGQVEKPIHLGQLARVVVGSTPSRANPTYWDRGTVNWINSGKANEFRVLEPSELITELGLAGSSVKIMPPGSTLIGITGATMGQISRLEITAGGSQNVAGVWSEDPMVNDWLFFDIQARVGDLTKHASGGAQQHINKKIITELGCVVPDASSLAAWHAVVSPLLASITHALMENRTLVALRDVLLPQLMSGRLQIKDAEKLVEDVT